MLEQLQRQDWAECLNTSFHVVDEHSATGVTACSSVRIFSEFVLIPTGMPEIGNRMRLLGIGKHTSEMP